MRILAVGCHPDDLEIGCYGTLALYRRLGHDVAVCHVANGNLGHAVILPGELREIRLAEAKAAAKIIGAAHYSIDANDLYISAENDELVDRLAKVVRTVRPDVIITHAEQDYMNDHIQTFYATLRASFAASCNHFDLSATVGAAPVCPLYHMDTLAGVGFLPTEYVDISEVIETKLEALACHRSQIDWMREHDGVDFLDFVRACSKVRGYQCGVRYAEGFRASERYLRLTPRRLLPQGARSSGGAFCIRIVDPAKPDSALPLTAPGRLGADADGGFVWLALRKSLNYWSELPRKGSFQRI